MGLARQLESRVAFALALDLLDIYLDDEVGVVLEEFPVRVRIADVIGVDGHLPNPEFDEWRYTLNCALVPSCCAGECGEFDLTPIGHLDIITPRSTYTFSIDMLTTIEWWER